MFIPRPPELVRVDKNIVVTYQSIRTLNCQAMAIVNIGTG